MPAGNWREYYLKNRDKYIRYAIEYNKSHPELQVARRQKPEAKEYQKNYHKEWVQKNNKHFAGYMSQYIRKKRLEVIKLLGSRCSNESCQIIGGCNDIRCLEIDHINNDGYIERKKISGVSAYLYYLRNPDEAKRRLQILCSNCNKIKEHERLASLRN